MTRLSVIGTGYLGTTHAACMAHLGHEVIAFDVDRGKIESLKKGELPFFEPNLNELVQEGLATGRLKFTSEIKEVTEFSQIHFVCVGTPQLDEGGAADISQLEAAAKLLAENLTAETTVIGKSTVPVGTAQWLEQFFKEHSNFKVNVVWNPEFLREGFAVKDTLNPDRIVLGVSSNDANKIVENIYASTLSTGTPVIVTNFATAELVKVAANAFLATKISFINAFADLCDVTGANITTLADAIGYDSRIGRKFLNAGIGFGGGCLPKDIRALYARASELDLAERFEFLLDVDEINQSRVEKTVQLARQLLGELAHKKITILGASFKPNSDDIRNSPSLQIANSLAEKGAIISVHDPVAIQSIKVKYPELPCSLNIFEAVKDSELILHLTEWSEYRDLDPNTISELVKNKIIIDGRNFLDRETWNSAGWKIIYLGKPSS